MSNNVKPRKLQLFMSCCKKLRGCTHRGSQDDECVCVGMRGLLLSIELPPELSKHLGASERLRAHLLSHLFCGCSYCGYSHSPTHSAWGHFNCHSCLAEKVSKCMLPPIAAKRYWENVTASLCNNVEYPLSNLYWTAVWAWRQFHLWN